MRFFSIPTLLIALESILIIGDASAIDPLAPKCDKKCAKSLIQRNPRSKSFCSSYLRAHGASTRTITVTTKAKTSCVTVTRTKVTTSLDVFSNAETTTFLPVITITEYSSTVVIATGSTRVIGKRSAKETELAARAPPCPSCRNLSSCSPKSISAACLDISPPKPVTKTITKPCTTITTTTETVRQFTEITAGTATIWSPPDTTTLDGVLTTYVPEECTRDLYSPPQVLNGAEPSILGYPDYAATPIECCSFCFKTKNCAAAAYSVELGECYLLIVKNEQAGEKTGMCPLGRQDFAFIRDFDFGVNALPGPCGF